MKSYPDPDLQLRIPADVWVLVGDQQGPKGAYVTATHIPRVYLAWIPKKGNDNENTNGRRQDPSPELIS